MGLVAGTFWSGWLYALLAAPGFPGTTTPLNFYSLSNSRMEAEGRNESHLLALTVRPLTNGWYEHSIRFSWPPYTGTRGWRVDESYLPPWTVDERRLARMGFYLELAAGDHIPWQTNERLRLKGGVLRFPDGRIFTVIGDQLVRGELLEFSPANPSPIGLGMVDGELRMTLPRQEPVFLRGLVRRHFAGIAPQNQEPLGQLVITLPPIAGMDGSDSMYFYPEGRCVYPTERPIQSRLDQLIQSQHFPHLFGWAVLPIAGLLLGAGLVLLHSGTQFRSLNGGIGAFLVTLGFTVPACLLVPPGHGPDEFGHLLSFARLAPNPVSALVEMVRYGESIDHSRTKQRPDEKLGNDPMTERGFAIHPGLVRGPALNSFVQDYRWRSPAVARLWQWLAAGFDHRPVGETVLRLKLLQIFLAAAAVGVGTWLAVPSLNSVRGLLLWPFWIIALPAFWASVSNYAILTAFSTVVASSMIALWGRSSPSLKIAAILGATSGLILATSLNAFPVVAGLAVWLLHLPMVEAFREKNVNSDTSVGRSPYAWWLLFGATMTGVLLATHPWGEYAEIAVSNAGRGGGFGKDLPWAILVIWIACAAMGAWQTRWRSAPNRWLPGVARSVALRLPWMVALAGLLTLMVSLHAVWFGAPTLRDTEAPWRPMMPTAPNLGCPLRTVNELFVPLPRPGLAEAIAQNLLTFFGNMTPWVRDEMLSKAAYSGLLQGEARTPLWIPRMGWGFVSLLLICWAARLWRGGDPSDTLRFILGGLALILTLVLLSLAYSQSLRNLYGRYLFPTFIIFFGVVTVVGLRSLIRHSSSRFRAWTEWGLLFGTLFVQATWVAVLVKRFF